LNANNLNKNSIYANDCVCYSCKCLVTNDSTDTVQVLASLRAQLETIQACKAQQSVQPGKRLWSTARAKTRIIIPFLSKANVLARAREDKIRTALSRWRNLLLVRCFNSWKIYRRDADPASPRRTARRGLKKRGRRELEETESKQSEALSEVRPDNHPAVLTGPFSG